METLRITEVKKTDYVYNTKTELYIHKDYIGVNDYWYEDTEGNIKPILFCKRWGYPAGDYLGYADKDGTECIIKFVD